MPPVRTAVDLETVFRINVLVQALDRVASRPGREPGLTRRAFGGAGRGPLPPQMP